MGQQKTRPVAITIICVLGFMGVAIIIPTIFSDVARQFGSWCPPYLALSGVIGLVCLVGLWNMKKWAAYTYIGFAVINQIVHLIMGLWGIWKLIIPAIIVGIILAYIKRMD